jgi:hypothetical protein
MSALLPKAGIHCRGPQFGFTPIADIAPVAQWSEMRGDDEFWD